MPRCPADHSGPPKKESETMVQIPKLLCSRNKTETGSEPDKKSGGRKQKMKVNTRPQAKPET